jgi:tetratricopeptide (TPR) repeat protein
MHRRRIADRAIASVEYLAVRHNRENSLSVEALMNRQDPTGGGSVWYLSLRPFRCKSIGRKIVFPGAVLIAGLIQPAAALEQSPTAQAQLQEHIADDIRWIQQAQKDGMEPLKLGRLWAHLAGDYQDQMEFAKSEAAYNRALRLLEPLPDAQKDYAVVLDNLGSLYVMSGKWDDSERCRKRALVMREALGDELEVARGKAHLAEVHLGRHKYKEARQEVQEAYTGMIALKEPEPSHVVAALVTLIYSECELNQCKDAVDHARTAVSYAGNVKPVDVLALGQAHLALGYAEWRNGIKDNPDKEMREGIRIIRSQELPTHPYVLSAMEQYRAYLESVHREAEAREIAEQEHASPAKPGDSCSECTLSMYGLRAN